MSIVLIRDAFNSAAGDKLHLDTLLMHYAEDRRAQLLTASGTLADGEQFTAQTAPFLGDTAAIIARAQQLVAEILDPETREQGTVINVSVAKGAPAETTPEPAHAVEPKPVAASPARHEPAKPAPKTHPHRR